MNELLLHKFHEKLGARFLTLADAEAVESYGGDALAEYRAPENFSADQCPLCAQKIPITRF